MKTVDHYRHINSKHELSITASIVISLSNSVNIFGNTAIVVKYNDTAPHSAVIDFGSFGLSTLRL